MVGLIHTEDIYVHPESSMCSTLSPATLTPIQIPAINQTQPHPIILTIRFNGNPNPDD